MTPGLGRLARACLLLSSLAPASCTEGDADATAATPAPQVPAPSAGVGAGPSATPRATEVAAPGAGGEGGARAPSTPEAPLPTDAGAFEAPSDAAAPDIGDAAAASDTELTWLPDPGWACGMPDGIPAPGQGTFVFEVTAQLGEVRDAGLTPYGHRRLIEIRGGSLEGEDIRGQLLDGGLDWELTLDNGVVEVEQALLLRADDGTAIYLRNCGVAATPDATVRVAPDFEAPAGGPHAWLNQAHLVGTRQLDETTGTLTMRVYDITGIAPPDGEPLPIERPAGTPGQSWDCLPADGSRGEIAFTETVAIGGSVRVGMSKRGTRNAIPITGGTTTGRVAGRVLPGGADFQLLDGGFVLDARYSLLTDDEELILVRNCGPSATLVPRFETRSDGPYSWLNEDRWLSSSPGVAIGAVNITVYERQ